MEIMEIYEKYNVMPNLQEHMLRVAAVGKIICDEINKSNENKIVGGIEGRNIVDTQSVVTACLLHDMGNIIKFDLNYFPEFLEPQGLEYWQNVQNEYFEKYGKDEHVATLEIAKEVLENNKDKENVLEIISAIGFGKSIKNAQAETKMEFKIAQYCDQRVGPHGVLSLEDRIADGRKRYAEKMSKSINGREFENLAQALKNIEGQIFAKTSIISSSISDQTTNLEIEYLKKWEI